MQIRIVDFDGIHQKMSRARLDLRLISIVGQERPQSVNQQLNVSRFALPNGKHAPALLGESVIILSIAFDIPYQFRAPKFRSRLRRTRSFAILMFDAKSNHARRLSNTAPGTLDQGSLAVLLNADETGRIVSQRVVYDDA